MALASKFMLSNYQRYLLPYCYYNVLNDSHSVDLIKASARALPMRANKSTLKDKNA
jgi:hypothetical protein